MRGILRDIVTALMLGMVLPGTMLGWAVSVEEKEEIVETVAETVGYRRMVTVENVGEMEMEEYILGVVLAEMPASFEPEALKAQAVAARTYGEKVLESGVKHGENRLCGDGKCCQCYISPENYISCGGTEENVQKVQKAVSETAEMVLRYGGELIDSTYFSCSGGYTEAALAVWGADVPYLQAVESPGEAAPYDRDWAAFTPEEFRGLLGAELPGSPKSWIGEVRYTAGGGVASMEIGGERYTGVELRGLLGLRSTAFTILPGEETITIETRGWGHRVGLSQYGAEAMAEDGKGFREILEHYYPGAEVGEI